MRVMFKNIVLRCASLDVELEKLRPQLASLEEMVNCSFFVLWLRFRFQRLLFPL